MRDCKQRAFHSINPNDTDAITIMAQLNQYQFDSIKCPDNVDNFDNFNNFYANICVLLIRYTRVMSVNLTSIF